MKVKLFLTLLIVVIAPFSAHAMQAVIPQQVEVDRFINELEHSSDYLALNHLKNWSARGHSFNVSRALDGYTPLIITAAKNWLACVTYLCEQNVAVNATNNAGETALHCAKYREIVSVLCEKGASIHAKSNTGKTALMLAAERGLEWIVQFLHSKNANPEDRDNLGNTALMLAIASGMPDSKTIIYLAENTKDLAATDKAGLNGFALAKKKFLSPEVMRPLKKIYRKRRIPLPDEVVPPQTQSTAPSLVDDPVVSMEVPELIMPEGSNSAKPQPELAESITDSNARSLVTKLITDACKNAETLDTRLLEQIIKDTNETIRELFAKAVTENNRSLIAKLLPLLNEATLTFITKYLLFESVKTGSLENAKRLFTLLDDPNIQNAEAQTLLMIATERANNDRLFLGFVSLLHKAKADGKIKDREGRIFLDYASAELMEEMPCWTAQYEQYTKEKKS